MTCKSFKLSFAIFAASFVGLFACFGLSSCESDDDEQEKHVSMRTLVMFMPWSTNLKPYFDENIKSFAKAIEEGILDDEHVVVCISTSPTRALLIELKMNGDTCLYDTLLVMNNVDFTNTANITKMLKDVRGRFPALHYSLVVGGHGMAWIPSSSTTFKAPYHSGYGSHPLTRWFGGLDADTQIEIPSFAESIRRSGLHMDYILFDDCLMSSVEVAYDLRKVTDFLVACPTEVMVDGFPYSQCAKYLVGQVDYKNLCETFLSFYESYFMPCGTVAVTDCRVLDELASSVLQMNLSGKVQYNDTVSIQQMDGYYPPIFYDLGDSYDKMCADSVALSHFHGVLAKAVPYKANTPYYYSEYGGIYKIKSFSGLTTSEFSLNPVVADIVSTSWYMDTH